MISKALLDGVSHYLELNDVDCAGALVALAENVAADLRGEIFIREKAE